MLEFEVKSRVQPMGERKENGHEREPCRTRLSPPLRPLEDDELGGRGYSDECPQNPENRLHPEAEDARCRQWRGVEH